MSSLFFSFVDIGQEDQMCHPMEIYRQSVTHRLEVDVAIIDNMQFMFFVIQFNKSRLKNETNVEKDALS